MRKYPLSNIETDPATEITMPAKSKAQQKAAGAALSAKRGETPKKELKGASKGMYESMTEKELDDLASTKRKELPQKADKDA
ncbi:MAG: hypothetical protein JWS11_1157 [Cypionkella sp.]|nr:hypothetical protein [Cypionkella sp.]